MTTVEPWNVPRSASAKKPQRDTSLEAFTYIQDVFDAGGDTPTVEVPRFHGPTRRTDKFTAFTCRKCAAIVLAGQILGLRLHLEPHMLNDQTEYNALHDQVPTYDLWPDRIARRRHHAHITHPTRVPRHAQHTCHTTYGTTPRPTPPAPPHAAPHSATPPF
jgi:hypothetical protein